MLAVTYYYYDSLLYTSLLNNTLTFGDVLLGNITFHSLDSIFFNFVYLLLINSYTTTF